MLQAYSLVFPISEGLLHPLFYWEVPSPFMHHGRKEMSEWHRWREKKELLVGDVVCKLHLTLLRGNGRQRAALWWSGSMATRSTAGAPCAVMLQLHCCWWGMAARSGSGVPRVGGWGVQTPPKFWRPSKIVPNSTRLWKLLKIAEFRTPTHQDVRKKGSKILKLPRFAIVLH